MRAELHALGKRHGAPLDPRDAAVPPVHSELVRQAAVLERVALLLLARLQADGLAVADGVFEFDVDDDAGVRVAGRGHVEEVAAFWGGGVLEVPAGFCEGALAEVVDCVIVGGEECCWWEGVLSAWVGLGREKIREFFRGASTPP